MILWPLFAFTLLMWAVTARMFWARGYSIAALACALAGFGYLLIGISYEL